MSNWYYLFFNVLVFVPVLVLSFKTDVQPHKQWRALLLAYALVSLPFIGIDIIAAQQSLWYFNELYISAYQYVQLPPEEILFFFTVPFAMLYVWGVIKKHVAAKPMGTVWPLVMLATIVAGATTLGLVYWGQRYTMLAAGLVIVTAMAVGASTKLLFDNRFWIFQIALLGIFIMANAILTSLPIITYNASEIIGLKLYTIPLEDFLFNFAFINSFLVAFTAFEQSHSKN